MVLEDPLQVIENATDHRLKKKSTEINLMIEYQDLSENACLLSNCLQRPETKLLIAELP